MFDLAGYSERGMVNALFYDVRTGQNSAEQLRRLASVLGQGRFLNIGGNLTRPFENAQFSSAAVRVEQSVSDYGDLDALVLLEEVAKLPD